MRSMRRGGAFGAPPVWVRNPDTGVRTSGTTSASGGILGRESFRGPPHAEQDIATGVLTSVQRGHAHPEDKSPPTLTLTSPLDSASRESSLACCPLGSETEVDSKVEVGGT